MRSFAAIAGLAAVANAAAAYYPAEPSSVEYPSYEETSSVAYPEYPAETSSAAYPAYPVASSSAPSYAEESSAEYPSYPVSSSAAYPAYSSAPAYPAYSSAPAYTTTEVVYGLTTVCPEPTTVTYGSKTYTVSSSTTLVDDDCEYTTTYMVKPTPSAVKTPVYSAYVPPKVSSAVYVPYPSANWTAPAGTAAPTAGKPSSTKPASPEFTGAAGKATAGLLAIAAGAMAAFL